MSGQWLLTSMLGGFFGMSVALALAYLMLRGGLVRLMKLAHDKNECPVCKGPMQHDHEAS